MDTANTIVIQATNIFYLQRELLPGFCSHSVLLILLTPTGVVIPDIYEIMPLSHTESSNGFPLHWKSTHLTHKAPHDRTLPTSQILFIQNSFPQLIILLPHWPSFSSFNIANSFSLQSLCMCCSFCLEWSSFRSLQGWLLLISQVSSQAASHSIWR